MNTAPTLERTEQDSGDLDPHHIYCPCNEDLALCGEDISGHEDTGDITPWDALCPMCEVLNNNHYCRCCGEAPE